MGKISIPYRGDEQGTTYGGMRSIQIAPKSLLERLSPADRQALLCVAGGGRVTPKGPHRFLPSQALVLHLLDMSLEKPTTMPWSWQGLGMFRLYLSREVRLHVWAPATAAPNVSTIHSHPWDFESKIVFGRMTDMRYRIARLPSEVEHDPRVSDGSLTYRPEAFHEQTIVCGPGGCAVGTPRDVLLLPDGVASGLYQAGEGYAMKAAELHESLPESGTVTIIRRTFHADTEHAHVYHRAGTPWVSAEPRAATAQEVWDMAKLVLDKHGGGSSGAGG